MFVVFHSIPSTSFRLSSTNKTIASQLFIYPEMFNSPNYDHESDPHNAFKLQLLLIALTSLAFRDSE